MRLPSNLSCPSAFRRAREAALAAAWGLALCLGHITGAGAAIAPGSSGNGELFLVIQDSTAQISYTVDLGVRMDDFFILAQQDEGVQRFWGLDPAADAELRSFLAQTSPANYVWAVMAIDSFGPAIGGAQRLYTTARQGEEGNVALALSQNLRSGIGNTSFANFLNGVNTSGTHQPFTDYSINGSSVNNITDPSASYFGEGGGTGPRLQGNVLSFNVTNAVGQSSWFYGVGSALTIGPVSVDEFDNLSHDGYFGFVFVDPNQNPTSPYAGDWLLSYTLMPAMLQSLALTPTGRARASLTEYLAGDITRQLAVPLNEFEGYSVPVVTPVPEPGALWLLSAGALALTMRRKTVRTAKPALAG